jgi:hypothetical protein
MSRTVDLFLDSDQPLERVAAQLSELTGQQFVALPDGSRFVLQDGQVSAYLAEHDFLDDDDLPLSEFRYVLSASVRTIGSIEDSLEVECLRRVNAQLRSNASFPSLLVIDLERPDADQVNDEVNRGLDWGPERD